MLVHTITTKYNLIFEGKCVGKRVMVNSDDKSTAYSDVNMYDMDLETHSLIVDDFRGMPSIIVLDHGSVASLTLVPHGDKLVTDDGRDFPELTYSKVAELSSHENWKGLQGTDVRLKRIYNEYNHRYFNGNLPALIGIKWNTRIASTWGRYRFTVRKRNGVVIGYNHGYIELSSLLSTRTPEEFRDILVHEMIHVLHLGDGHGRLFKITMRGLNYRYGLNLSVYCSEGLDWRYRYMCKSCGNEFYRLKRLSGDLSDHHCAMKIGNKKCKGDILLAEVNE